MTNTLKSRQFAAPRLVGTPQLLSRDADTSLVEQIVRSIETRIDDKLLRTGSRMPSIRQYAEFNGVSRFTVVEAYDRLVAKGFLESRRGSGFYVRERSPLITTHQAPQAHQWQPPLIDVVWLVRNMFRQMPNQKKPGTGMLPTEWLDGDLIANALRAISRQNASQLLGYGDPQGFLPLRQQLQLKLAELEIAVTPEQIVTTTGVTQALDIVARHFTQPGDVIFVDDPTWFLMFGSFAALGAKVIGIPRLADGPDIVKLAELAAIHKPKLYVLVSVLHNPTSTSMSAAKAFQTLKIAEEHDFIIVEDDIYCDMHPGSAVQPATRLATLDQLNRVIYLGGFAKTLSANLRVGFIATSHETAQHLADRKMLTTLTTSEIGERVVYKILSEGHYRKHADRLRTKMDIAREKTVRHLVRIGMNVDIAPPAGMFIWVDTGYDTNILAEKAAARGFMLAPGALFSPNQLPSTRMRINVAAMSDPEMWRFLEEECQR
ncbi:aminotransferase-like domain-containing protein [Glaciimonas immobilis]|uniref:DNA-binding transcriptional MocR family regulator n=1 Tax=Glaciimonas immobilis TaxID=728004 RepID=A0A840RLZ0_9BURK|nr:PLP-dependent aminotransferase family protein [Glaciimonas immobilis]KAF3999304.1 PLP-dependent aminotransferase family protein [Glaciimonas immobilis]MBB5198783.1 DNA-binding transcriptional MocR family regulator [Glaciimonas immobilis]